MAGKGFASVIIMLDLFASASYLCSGDWRRCIYWCAAAVLTICVTY